VAAGFVRLRAPAPIFSALGDPTRLRVVDRLCAGGPLSIARLTAGSSVTRQAITKHLRVLADADLVRSVRRGRESVWELKPQRLEEARRWLDRISRQWDDALGRLKSAVER
jgi:DNA-binding transcriptional ArsR family regulator